MQFKWTFADLIFLWDTHIFYLFYYIQLLIKSVTSLTPGNSQVVRA